MDSIDTTNSIIGITIFGSVALSLGNLPSVALEANGVVPKLAQAITQVKINRPTLDIGSEGERVSELQAVLKLLGYYTGEVNGFYGDNTAIAVSKL
ncbi:MAG: peptidoglycan-binding protein, partial [Moorea sp. SIO4G2]|nr:peptidoglycan-binding protein [Moorena sp. SIO4G2]